MKKRKKENYLIAVDLDGTIIKDFDKIDQKSFRYLKSLRKNNFIIIATARSFQAAEKYYKKLKLKTPIITYNGALVHNPSDKSFPKRCETIKREDFLLFLKLLEKEIVGAFCEKDDTIFITSKNKLHLKYTHPHKRVKKIIGPFSETLNCDIYSAVIFFKDLSYEKIKYTLKHFFSDKYNVRFWYKENNILVTEFYKIVNNKLAGFNYIKEKLNIPFAKTIAIGDAENDLLLLKNVNKGAIMSGFNQNLNTDGIFITKSIDDSGVRFFLKKVFEEK